MKTRKIIYTNKKIVFFTIKDKRTFYYKGKLNNKKIVNKIRVSKDKMYLDIIKLKKTSK